MPETFFRRNLLVDALPPCRINLHTARLAELHAWNFPQLRSPFWRCYLPVTEGGEVNFEGKIHLLTPGTGLLIPPDTSFSTYTRQPFRKAYCHFDCLLPGLPPAPGVYPFTPRPEMLKRFHSLIDSLQPEVSGASQSATRLSLHLLEITTCGLLDLPEGALSSRPVFPREVRETIERMKENLSRPLNNDVLAAGIGLHPNSFVRLFTREARCAPQKYYRRLRLEVAALLLGTTHSTLETIAEKTGFYDRNHLTRAFQKEWGCPPAEFRKRSGIE